MDRNPQKPADISQEEWDAHDMPEATAEEFALMRPMAEVYAEHVARNKGGRPKLSTPTVKVGWRMPVDLVEALRGTGRGYTDRIEAVLRQAMAEGRLQPDDRQAPPAGPALL